MALGPISNNGFAEKLPKFCSNSPEIQLKLLHGNAGPSYIKSLLHLQLQLAFTSC